MRRELLPRLGRILLPLLVLGAGLAGAVALMMLRPEVEAARARERVWLVRAVEVRPGRVQPRIRHFGRLEVARRLVLAPAVGGRVLEVSPKLVDGGRVAAGEVLLRLDPFAYERRIEELQAQLDQQRAQLAELEADLEAQRRLLELVRRRVAVAERERARQERLVARKVASPRALDQAERQLLAEREALVRVERQIATLAQRRVAQTAVLRALEASLARARRELADTVLRAPETGILDSVQVAVGHELAPRTRIALLYPEDAFELRFSLTEAEMGRLLADGLVGRRVRAIWRLGGETLALEGRIARVLGRIDPRTGGVALAASLDGPPPPLVRPGIFLRVEVPDRIYEDAVRLPKAALYGADTVYAVEEGRLVPREVEVLAREGGTVVVRGALRAGDRVLVTHLPEAGPGVRVEMVEEAGA